MLNFEKEIHEFQFLDTDNHTLMLENEAVAVIDTFNNVLKRLGREQSNVNTQLEELVALADEGMEKERGKEELQKRLDECETEKLALVKVFIDILDQMEDLYRYSTAVDYGNWTSQIRLLWDNINNTLLSSGVVRIDGLNTTFNPSLQIVKITRDEPSMQEGLIIEVLKSGYVYKSAVVRKAEVVVNKKESESVYYEQNNWNRLGDVNL